MENMLKCRSPGECELAGEVGGLSILFSPTREGKTSSVCTVRGPLSLKLGRIPGPSVSCLACQG